MRKLFRKHLPDHRAVSENRWLAPFSRSLLHPRLWHLNRHSAAGAVAVGMFCGLIPGPFQMLGAALCCLAFRVNLPLALFTTLYTNPLTIVPLYIAAYEIGRLLLGENGRPFSEPPAFDLQHFADWSRAMIDWALGLGRPLVFGIVVLAVLLAAAGYLLVRGGWRLYLIRAWRARGKRRKAGAA
ncbi:MAG: hypothetical protein BGO63_19230 [Candidatus Accumulibacter sp. 66-26]|nr:DUF2062 domain-containing protein [Accumulibacter sp.]OJW52016.1 MAG: hypothetical protein BGO63_19230 [Candidatus Accumulibacter sp. 66-26]